MSNMKNTNRYTVAFGPVPPDVIEFCVKDFGRIALGMEYIEDVGDIEDMEASQAVIDDRRYFVAGNVVDMVALASLDEYYQNTPDNQLRIDLVGDDYMCCTPRHHTEQISCYCALDDCIACDIYKGFHYSGHTIIEWYYIVPTE
jgi:hypothetical protein